MVPVLPDQEGEMMEPVPRLCWRERGCPCEAFAHFRSRASIGQRFVMMMVAQTAQCSDVDGETCSSLGLGAPGGANPPVGDIHSEIPAPHPLLFFPEPGPHQDPAGLSVELSPCPSSMCQSQGTGPVGICPVWLLKVSPMPRLPMDAPRCCFVSAEGGPYARVRSDLAGPACLYVPPASTGRGF